MYFVRFELNKIFALKLGTVFNGYMVHDSRRVYIVEQAGLRFNFSPCIREVFGSNLSRDVEDAD
jgi:hypothetical protein